MAANLTTIQTKFRRLTRNLSPNQISNTEINDYINTFLLYDFPEHVRLFRFNNDFTFVCNPYQTEYPTDIDGFGGASAAADNLLYNFQNKYLNIMGPVYIAGYQSMFTQSREQFFGIYPIVNNIQSIGTAGDGVTTSFSGFVLNNTSINPLIVSNNNAQQMPLLKRNVLFSSVDVNNNGISLADVPLVDSVTGMETIYGNLYDPNSLQYQTAIAVPPTTVAPYTPTSGGFPDSDNYINYLTGEFTITFPTAPAAAQAINSDTVPQIPSLPQSMLYYNNKIHLRPMPDQPYRINFQVWVRPTELIENNQIPELEEFWEFIAYGAVRKYFQDKQDVQSLQAVEPEYNFQMRKILRRTIVQNTTQRTATIYTEQCTGFGSNWGGWGWGAGGALQ